VASRYGVSPSGRACHPASLSTFSVQAYACQTGRRARLAMPSSRARRRCARSVPGGFTHRRTSRTKAEGRMPYATSSASVISATFSSISMRRRRTSPKQVRPFRGEPSVSWLQNLPGDGLAHRGTSTGSRRMEPASRRQSWSQGRVARVDRDRSFLVPRGDALDAGWSAEGEGQQRVDTQPVTRWPLVGVHVERCGPLRCVRAADFGS
jgi:hypothetical protein